MLAEPAPHVPSLGDPVVWTGKQLIVWGSAGPNPNATGASYDPATDRWEDLPPAPAGPRDEHTAVWTGTEVLFWGRSPAGAGPNNGPTGLAYDPSERTWRVLPEAPIPDRAAHQAVWTGKEMVIWGGLEGNVTPHHGAQHAGSAAAYDPATNSWRGLPDVPFGWSGEGGEAMTFLYRGDALIYRAGEVVRLSTAADRWEEFGDIKPGPGVNPNARSHGGEDVTGAISGDELYIWSGDNGPYRGNAMSLRTGEWRPLAGRAFAGPPSEIAAAPGSFFVAADHAGSPRVSRYDLASDRWETVPPPQEPLARGPAVIWTGRELLAINGYRIDDGPRTSAAFGPRSGQPAR